jgi:hypothetical protein
MPAEYTFSTPPVGDLAKFVAYCVASGTGIAGTSAATSNSVTAVFSSALSEAELATVQDIMSAYDSSAPPRIAEYQFVSQTFPKMTLGAADDGLYRTVLSSSYSGVQNAAPLDSVVVGSGSAGPFAVRIVDVPRVLVLGAATFSNTTLAENWVHLTSAPSDPTVVEVQVAPSSNAPVQISSVAFAYPA